jgi:hypothetical protein
VLNLAKSVGFRVNIVPSSGHQLDRLYVSGLLFKLMCSN